MKILLQNKGFKKRMGGGFYRDIAPCLNATDYKEPNIIIETDDERAVQPRNRRDQQDDKG